MNIKDLVIKKLRTKTRNKFNESSSIDDIGIDSLDFVELITEAEDELKITISDDALEAIKTIGDIITTIEKAQNEEK